MLLLIVALQLGHALVELRRWLFGGARPLATFACVDALQESVVDVVAGEIGEASGDRLHVAVEQAQLKDVTDRLKDQMRIRAW